MKKIILIIGILIFSLNCKSQNQKAILYLKNGDTIQGFAKITNFGKIKFRPNEKSKRKKYDATTLEKFEIKEKYSYYPVTYTYKLVQDNYDSSKPVLMEMILEGKINLYKMTTTTSHAPMGVGGVGGAGGMGFGMPMSNSFDNYYVCRDNSDTVVKLTTLGTFFGKNFTKAASEYFSDCQNLVNKIKDKTYHKSDIEDIVMFYNTECNK